MAKKMKKMKEARTKPVKKISANKKPISGRSDVAPKMSPSVPGSKADAALSSLTKGKR